MTTDPIRTPKRLRRRITAALRPFALALPALASACGAAGPPALPQPYELRETPPPAPEATTYRPRSALEESRRLYAKATATSDARERCGLLREASTLDAANFEARAALGESRCAPARELIEDARAAFALQPGGKTAATLLAVAVRAGSKRDAVSASAALEKGADLDGRVAAARAMARFGEHGVAAAIFDAIAVERTSKGAQLDGIDARLEAVIERARAGAPAGKGLLEAIGEGTPAASTYGAAWVELKLVDAIAAVRAAGDENAAKEAVKQAKARRLLVAPETKRALEIAEAVAAARSPGGAKGGALAALVSEARRASHAEEPASRALLAVEARLAGRCAEARAHAEAHDAAASNGLPRFDDDLAWARACSPSGPKVPSVVPSVASDAVEDAVAVGAIDPLRGRAMLSARLDAAPDDEAAILASIALARPDERLALANAAIARLPELPGLRAARFALLPKGSRADEVRALVVTVLPKTIEVRGDPRAAAAFLARLLGEAPADDDPAARPLSEAIVHACAAKGATGRCGVRPAALRVAARVLRRGRAATLATDAPALTDDDLRDAPLRLDLVLALLDLGAVRDARALASERRGRWSGAEQTLAEASLEAVDGKCSDARQRVARVGALDASFARDVAWVRERCAR